MRRGFRIGEIKFDIRIASSIVTVRCWKLLLPVMHESTGITSETFNDKRYFDRSRKGFHFKGPCNSIRGRSSLREKAYLRKFLLWDARLIQTREKDNLER